MRAGGYRLGLFSRHADALQAAGVLVTEWLECAECEREHWNPVESSIRYFTRLIGANSVHVMAGPGGECGGFYPGSPVKKDALLVDLLRTPHPARCRGRSTDGIIAVLHNCC